MANIPSKDLWKIEHWDRGLTVPPDYIDETKLGTEFRWEFGDIVITVDNYTRGWHIWSNLGYETIRDIRPFGRFEWINPKIQDAVYAITGKLKLRYNKRRMKRKTRKYLKRKNPDKKVPPWMRRDLPRWNVFIQYDGPRPPKPHYWGSMEKKFEKIIKKYTGAASDFYSPPNPEKGKLGFVTWPLWPNTEEEMKKLERTLKAIDGVIKVSIKKSRFNRKRKSKRKNRKNPRNTRRIRRKSKRRTRR